MATTRFQIPKDCPTEPDRRSVCVRCVLSRMLDQPGITKVDIQPAGEAASLELEYDPKQISADQLQRQFAQATACMSPHLAHIMLPLEGMAGPQSEQLIETSLNKLPGVMAVASSAHEHVRIEFDRRQCVVPEIVRRLEHLGFTPRFNMATSSAMPGQPQAAHADEEAQPAAPVEEPKEEREARAQAAQQKLEITLTAIAGVTLLGGFMTYVLDGPQWLRLSLLLISYITGGWFIAIDTLRVLARFRLDIDVLMFLAAFGAASLGKYEEGALLLFLFSLGHAGENMALDRARRAISALSKLAPDVATLLEPDGTRRIVRSGQLKPGDHVLLSPFQRAPCDGKVLSGRSDIDQSPITGESTPVPKSVGDDVYAGTINTDGALVISVTHAATESTLARIVKLVEEAQKEQSPTQVFTQSVERYYVPGVIGATACLIAGPPLLGGGEWGVWFYRAMAFLTAASPCALAIGTPAAVLCGIARAARTGLLIKGGAHLENLGRIAAIAFDKTGTLTKGRADLTDIKPLTQELAEESLLALAASVERVSSHPLASAIVAQCQARELTMEQADEIEQLPGLGVRGMIGGQLIAAGRLELLGADHPRMPEVARIASTLTLQGKSTVLVLRDGEPVGLLGLADQPRPRAAEALASLRRLGVKRLIMLTGDNPQAAQAIAARLGVDEVHAGLMPEQKVELLKQAAAKYGPVAMVGDGVNDAPALAAATVGIAMGTAGSDVALQTADVALVGDDLALLGQAIALSRFSRKIIRQNLLLALGVIGLLAPAAALGYAPLGLAVAFHEGSTILVVLNALRLLGFRHIDRG